jgi:hypothetical protein
MTPRGTLYDYLPSENGDKLKPRRYDAASALVSKDLWKFI